MQYVLRRNYDDDEDDYDDNNDDDNDDDDANDDVGDDHDYNGGSAGGDKIIISVSKVFILLKSCLVTRLSLWCLCYE